MELIYLWTKSYKNLKGGYNLSSKYNVEKLNSTSNLYNINLKNNEFYIKNFFDEDNKITINAIIGENGSGKSSILKLILNLLYNNEIKRNTNATNNSFLIIEINNELVYLTTNEDIKIKITFENKDIEIKKYDKKFYTIYFNYMLDSLKDHSKEDWIDNIYHKSDDYTMPILLEPYKKDNIVNFDNLNYLTRQRMITYKNEFKKNKFLRQIFEPKSVKVSIDSEKLLKIYNSDFEGKYTNAIKDVYSQEFDTLNHIQEKIEQEERNIKSVQRKYRNDLIKAQHIEDTRRQNIINLKNEIESFFYEKIPFHILNNLYIANKIDKYHNFKRNKNFTGGVDGFGLDQYKKRIQIYINDYSHNTQKLRNALKYHDDFILKGKDIKFDNLREIILSIDDERLNCLPSWFKVSFYDEYQRTFTSLSAGEKSFYILLSSIIYQLSNIESRKKLNYGTYSNILILLDEADLGLHPKWQRVFISNILETLKDVGYDFSFQVFCTSHSPFIVSDLPKNNILFLDNGQVTTLKDSEYTFGENIHTLLNDSFFMQKDMMMGKLAEDKIQKCFDFFEKIFDNNKKRLSIKEKNDDKHKLEKEKLHLEYLEKINYIKKLINILGENYIKMALLNSINECNEIFNIEDEISNKKNKILNLLDMNPYLIDKWLKDLE